VGQFRKHCSPFVPAGEGDFNPAGVDLIGLKYYGHNENVKILLRRYASEFRDNYLCKSDFLLNCAKQVKSLISK
jgi:hypothetical protein